MRKKTTVSSNYLEFIPVPNPEFAYETSEQGEITILRENKGFFHFCMQKLLKKPAVSYIHLDEMGNFIWPLMDGKRSILDIAELVKEEFGEKAEPLYDRLVTYMYRLESYGFISVEENSHFCK